MPFALVGIEVTSSGSVLERSLDLIGVVVFGASGALLAVRKGFDIVGMLVLAVLTATGGGVIRDLLIGAVPPAALTDPWYLLLPVVATAAVFFLHPWFDHIRRPVLVFDAAGLALYCVIGAVKALSFGIRPIAAIGLGVTAAVGGGIIRDVLAREVPTVFRQDTTLYAVPAFLGSAATVGAWQTHTYGPPAAVVTAIVVFVIRLLSLRYGWRAPSPRPGRAGRSADE
jgi:uncharacterized membrane protein YeiH